MNQHERLTQEWAKTGQDALIGKKIIAVRYLTEEEQSDLMWHSKCVVITLDDGTLIFPSQDDEGNDAGALYYQTTDQLNVLPVIN